MYLVINKWVIAVKVSNFSGQYLRNHWTLDIGVLGYIGIVWHKEHSPKVRSFPPGTPCIYIYMYIYIYICMCVCVCVCVRTPMCTLLYNQLFYPVMENVHEAVLVSTPLWGWWPHLGKMDENWSVAPLPGKACGGGWDRRARSSATNQLWRLNLCTTCKDSVWASQITHCASIRKTSRWMFYTVRAITYAAFTCITVWMSN